MTVIYDKILNRLRESGDGGGGGGGGISPSDLKTVGYDSLVKDPLNPVGNVEFGYNQQAQGVPGGQLYVGQQKVSLRTINGQQLVGNTDIVITPGDANMVATTYAALKALRDSEQLVPGTWYRITDYECTTIAPGTESALHQFDIVVLATGSDTLDENAFACRHAGDSYFTGEHIEAWRLKYCLDNDTSRFGWGDTDIGKGVIYWMRDEWGNEAPYDFKNICFARWAVSDLNRKSLTAEALQSLKDIFVYDPKDNPFFFGLQDTDYTHAGLSFEIDDETDFAYYYTFGGDTDRSLNGGAHGCYGNVIKPWIDNLGVQQLNNGVWVKTDIGKEQIHHSTTCGYNCHDWTCGNNCHGWTCGNECYGWTCGNNCYGWTCGNLCFGWTCGNLCYGWTCGNFCSSWTCGNDCPSWTCGNNCHNWTCGNNCHGWTCGNNCSNWTCGNNCSNWTCGNNCSNWTCGNNCQYFHILSGTTGDLSNLIAASTGYSQYVGFDSQGTLRSLNIFD